MVGFKRGIEAGDSTCKICRDGQEDCAVSTLVMLIGGICEQDIVMTFCLLSSL